MKRNGFTFVELLGVMVVLSLILLVSIPAIVGTLQDSNEKEKQLFLKDIYMACELFYENHLERFDFTTTVPPRIYVQELIDASYLPENKKNPMTDTKISEETSYVVLSKNSDGIVRYEFVQEEE